MMETQDRITHAMLFKEANNKVLAGPDKYSGQKYIDELVRTFQEEILPAYKRTKKVYEAIRTIGEI